MEDYGTGVENSKPPSERARVMEPGGRDDRPPWHFMLKSIKFFIMVMWIEFYSPVFQGLLKKLSQKQGPSFSRFWGRETSIEIPDPCSPCPWSQGFSLSMDCGMSLKQSPVPTHFWWDTLKTPNQTSADKMCLLLRHRNHVAGRETGMPLNAT